MNIYNIYFSHSMLDYNTVYEAESEMWIHYCIEYANDIKCNLINPRDIKVPPEINKLNTMCNVFLPAVSKCDALVAIPAGTIFNKDRTEKYTSGVLMEIEYAKRNSIPCVKLPHLLSACGRPEDLKYMNPFMSDEQMYTLLNGIIREEMDCWIDLLSNITQIN